MGTKYDPSTFGLRCLPGSSLPGRICSSFNLLPCWVYCNTEQSPSSPGTTSPIWIDSFFGTIGPGIWYGEDIGPFYSLAMMIQSTFLVVDSAGFSKAWYIQDIPSLLEVGHFTAHGLRLRVCVQKPFWSSEGESTCASPENNGFRKVPINSFKKKCVYSRCIHILIDHINVPYMWYWF